MIRFEMQAETPADFIRQLVALAAGFAVGENVAVTEVEETKPPKSTRKASAEKPSPEKEPVSEKDTTSPDKPSSAVVDKTKVDNGNSEVDVTDKASVKNFMSIGIDNLGVQTVSEVMAELGATKFGDIPANKYPALVTRLDDLMKAKGKE